MDIVPGIILQLHDLFLFPRLQCSYIVRRKGPLNTGSSIPRERMPTNKEHGMLQHIYVLKNLMIFHPLVARGKRRRSRGRFYFLPGIIHEYLPTSKCFFYVHNSVLIIYVQLIYIYLAGGDWLTNRQ